MYTPQADAIHFTDRNAVAQYTSNKDTIKQTICEYTCILDSTQKCYKNQPQKSPHFFNFNSHFSYEILHHKCRNS